MIDIKKIRADFPILTRKVNGHLLTYFDSAATAQKPVQVLEAIDEYFKRHNANVHRGVHTLSVEATEMMDEARAKIAKFIGAKSEEVIFVRNTTEAINLVAYSWGEDNINQGDEVIVSLMEHHSNLVPWQELAKRKGAVLKVINVKSDGVLDLENLRELLSEKTKMVAFTAVSNVLGTIVPVEKVREIVREKNANIKILVDAAQAVPHMKVNVDKWKVDFVAFSGHKMMGATGTGVLWGRADILNEMRPFMYGGDMVSEVKLTGAKWKELPYKFEAGTPDIAGAVALGVAVDYLNTIGMDEVRAHEKELIGYALEKMRELERHGVIDIYGPKDAEIRGGVMTFNMVGIHAHDVASVLDNYGIAIRSGQHCGAPIVESFEVPAMARASFYIYNTKDEIDLMIEKLLEVKKIFK